MTTDIIWKCNILYIFVNARERFEQKFDSIYYFYQYKNQLFLLSFILPFSIRSYEFFPEGFHDWNEEISKQAQKGDKEENPSRLL